MGLLFGVALWLAWSEVYRAENGLANSSGVVPTQTNFIVSSVIGFLTLALYFLSPLTFFIGGVELKMMGIALFSEFLVLGLGITSTIFFWFIYWVAGLIALFPTLFFAYSFYAVWVFYSHDPAHVCVVPVEVIGASACPQKYAYRPVVHGAHHAFVHANVGGAPIMMAPQGAWVGGPKQY